MNPHEEQTLRTRCSNSTSFSSRFPPDIAYSRTEMLSYIRHPKSISRVAELANTIAGFVVGNIEPERAGHVLTLDVIPAVRRQGLGTALMEALHHEFEISGIQASY